MTVASVLIPSHARPGTLGLAVRSALEQTVPDVEVIVIGDGVTEDVRRVANALAAEDERVRFLDLPKGPHHGEVHRHEAILAARSEAIFYLCDDDLLMPRHVESLLDLLERHTLVMCLNGYISPDGKVHRYSGQLAESEAVAMIMRTDTRYNFISITGTAHSRSFYLEADRPWTTTPDGEWPDHAQFRRMLDRPGFSGATSTLMTALQFPATLPERHGWTHEQQLAELEEWSERIRVPGAQEALDMAVAEATELEFAHAVRELQLAVEELHRIRDGRAAMESTLSWRLTSPLRALRRRL